MNIPSFIKDPHTRIEATHFLVVLILLANILFFTESTVSIVIQFVLIVAVILHNKDDRYIKGKLEESESKLREDTNIFDRNIIVSEADLTGKITYVNNNFCEISGYTKEELLGQQHNVLRDPDTSKEFFEDLWKTIQSGETFHGIIKNIKKNGDPYWIDAAISPIKKDSKIVGYKAIRFDITDKVLTSESFKGELVEKDRQLQEQNKRFEFAINSSRDGFWDLDIKAKEFYLSSGWRKRLGFKEEQTVTYLDYLALIPDEYRVEHHEAMTETIEKYPNKVDYVHFRIRYPLFTKFGERLLIEDVGDAFFDKDQELIRITGFHRDITEHERQAKMIESQNRVAAMGDMIGNIAHQWRQPIGAINNALNDLEFDIELEDLETVQASQFLETSKKVKEYTSHLSQTIDDFRNLTSDEKVQTEFLLTDVLDEAYSIVKDDYDKQGVDFSVNVIGECTCIFKGYKRELIQVIINILNNAKDIFMEKSIEDAKVVLTLDRNDTTVCLSIHDNAGGIPESIIDKIFDPYFTTKHEALGTGIGLFMSKKMISEHFQGSLNVENEGSGAKFNINLPRQDL